MLVICNKAKDCQAPCKLGHNVPHEQFDMCLIEFCIAEDYTERECACINELVTRRTQPETSRE